MIRKTILGLNVLNLAILIVFYLIVLHVSKIEFSMYGMQILHKKFMSIYFVEFIFIIVNPLIIYFSLHRFNESFSALNEAINHRDTEILSNMEFTQDLIDQNFQKEVSVSQENNLGQSLLKLRDRLKANLDEEAIRKQEDFQRNWATEGQARFAEILRENQNKEIADIAYSIISNLTQYTGSNQGGFFLYVEEGTRKYYELIAFYAYERQRILKKNIEWGEGLIGRSGIEKQTIFLTDVPKDYIKITSGLGEETPTCLIIVPMKLNDTIYGAIEIASFKILEKYQIDFIEKISEIVASTISSVKINIQTAKLLHESQLQGEKLKKQEMDMRQNMEEMKVLQRESMKQSEEFVSFTNSVNHTMIRADYNPDGMLMYANTKFIKMLGYSSNSEVEGRNILSFIHDKDREWFNRIWKELSIGGKHYEGFMKHMTKDGGELWTLSTYTCIRGERGLVNKILYLAIDTTENKKQSLNYEGLIKALDRATLKVEFEINGNLINCNNNFLNTMGYSFEEIQGKPFFSFLHPDKLENFKENWNQILKKYAYDGEINLIAKEGAERFLFGSFSAVYDMYGEVSKVVFVANDITEQVVSKNQVEQQNDVLKQQEAKLQQAQIELSLKLENATKEIELQLRENEKFMNMFEKTLQGAADAIFIINSKGNFLFFNNAAEKLWGYQYEDIKDQNVGMLFTNEQKINNQFVRKLVTEKERKIIGERQEVVIVDFSGNEKHVLILLSESEYDTDQTYTAFVQNIDVELF